MILKPFSVISKYKLPLKSNQLWELWCWVVPSIIRPAFWCGRLLPWDFYFYNVRSLTPWIFALAGFLSVSGMDNLRACAIFAHFMACESLLWSWGFFVNLFPISDVFVGVSELIWGTWCLYCTSWGDSLVSEGVRCCWTGFKIFGASNGVIDPGISF